MMSDRSFSEDDSYDEDYFQGELDPSQIAAAQTLSSMYYNSTQRANLPSNLFAQRQLALATWDSRREGKDQQVKPLKRNIPNWEHEEIELVQDQLAKFHSEDWVPPKRLKAQESSKKRVKVDVEPAAFQHPQTFYSINLDSWEDRIIWDGDDVKQLERMKCNVKLRTPNYHLLNGSWENEIMWEGIQDDAEDTYKLASLTFDMNDTEFMVEISLGGKDDDDERKKKDASYEAYNLSLDHIYAAFTKDRVRTTFEKIKVQHSYPALKLYHPLYRRTYSNNELRMFHRPLMRIVPDTTIKFSRSKGQKDRKRLAKLDMVDAIPNTRALSLRERTNYCLFEFSEEYPLLMSNVGMGTNMMFYYRRHDDQDIHIPKSEYGINMTLNATDSSPFLNFGDVDKGTTIHSINNNLYRAPVFKHDAKSTDFLVVKHTYRGKTKYYLRKIPAIFAVGQSYPALTIPSPKKRNRAEFIKDWFRVLAYRLARHNMPRGVTLDALHKLFPEMEPEKMKGEMKAFLEYDKDGTGAWIPIGFIPGEKRLFDIVLPESVCVYHSALSADLYFEDLGINPPEVYHKDLPVEEKLAPWFLTKDFIEACEDKARLELHGAGDPTICGEGFSFIRSDMKTVFILPGEDREKIEAERAMRKKHEHKYTVKEEETKYRHLINHIWHKQATTLSSKEEPPVPSQPPIDDASTIYGESKADEDGASLTSRPESRSNFHNKNLIITRKVKKPDGTLASEEEVVTDPHVIQRYLTYRKRIDANFNINDIQLTNDEERNKAMRARLEANIQLLQQKSKKGKKKVQLSALNKPLTTRVCSACRERGHMKTYSGCPKNPRYDEFVALNLKE